MYRDRPTARRRIIENKYSNPYQCKGKDSAVVAVDMFNFTGVRHKQLNSTVIRVSKCQGNMLYSFMQGEGLGKRKQQML